MFARLATNVRAYLAKRRARRAELAEIYADPLAYIQRRVSERVEAEAAAKE